VLFSTPTFLFLFLPLVLALHFALPRRWRNGLLFAASLLFYAWGEQEVALVMLASIAGNYGFGRWVHAALEAGRGGAARAAVALAVTFNLGLLVVFKYAGFLVANANALLGGGAAGPLPDPGIELPIGISFFTFQALSYVVDVYRRDAPLQRNPVDFGLYIALFPQLIAGPIVRYRDIARQLASRVVDLAGFAGGVRRFVVGLAKKVLIADTVGKAADRIFDGVPGDELTTALAWLAVACYTLQIYFDFSAYSDMAIGLGRMFGLRFRENFDYPYVARSVTEFWRRWHVSLSTWFRDYLYVPLGGNRRGALRTYRNLLIVFVLCGLWHGASWTFLAWGAYHGAFLILERVGARRALERAPSPLRRVYLLLVVMVGWVFFRAETFGQAGAFLRAMAGLAGGDPVLHPTAMYLLPDVAWALGLGALGSTPVLRRAALLLGGREGASEGAGLRADLALPAAVGVACDLSLVVLLLVSMAFMAAVTSNPFIYFRF